MNKRSETIALLEWNWIGHHPTYFTYFAAAMAEAGAEVVPFCADPADFAQRLAGLDLSKGVLDHIARAEKVEGPRPSNFRPARWRGIYEARKFFGGLGKQLRAWETKHGRKIDLVFFACIYDHQFEFLRFAERLFSFPWSGLYLHSRGFRAAGIPMVQWGNRLPCPEKIFGSQSMQSIGMLDEGCLDQMKGICGSKPVFLFPDITDYAREPKSTGLAAKAREQAGGRPLVSLTGYLQRTKGLEEFTALVENPAMGDVFFVLAGELCWTALPIATRRNLEEVWRRAPNLLTCFVQLPEATMNAVIAESDVVFAAYKDFPNSSNVLTKAAFFHRPIVVSDGYLMAERVRRHNLGEVVPEGNLDSLVSAVTRMTAPGYYKNLCTNARWDEYAADHSLTRLRAVMRDLVESI
jgi:hypothetical protein